MSAANTPDLGALAAHVDGIRDTLDSVASRQDRLEALVEDRRESSEGVRRELSDHRVQDAGEFAKLNAAIAGLTAASAAMKWMLGLLIGLGLANGIAAIVRLAH